MIEVAIWPLVVAFAAIIGAFALVPPRPPREPMSIYLGITQRKAEELMAAGYRHSSVGRVPILIPPRPMPPPAPPKRPRYEG